MSEERRMWMNCIAFYTMHLFYAYREATYCALCAHYILREAASVFADVHVWRFCGVKMKYLE